MPKEIAGRPCAWRSLFNGKDLAGWKVYPGKKSKFTVTKEGWLNVKDGPGDLQTEGQWADFVCKWSASATASTSTAASSSAACPASTSRATRPRSATSSPPEPTQEYTVEEYDPRDAQADGQEEGQVRPPWTTAPGPSTAACRPARQVAKDGEWFTMTVVAHGRHLATWVNGVRWWTGPTTGPRSDNARQGCRLGKGAISIQGHDPTTDLSFRNLRIAELPGEK